MVGQVADIQAAAEEGAGDSKVLERRHCNDVGQEVVAGFLWRQRNMDSLPSRLMHYMVRN
jgi:hypothetical protein